MQASGRKTNQLQRKEKTSLGVVSNCIVSNWKERRVQTDPPVLHNKEEEPIKGHSVSGSGGMQDDTHIL